MTGLRRLIHEIHRRSLWQVLGIYLYGPAAVLVPLVALATAAEAQASQDPFGCDQEAEDLPQLTPLAVQTGRLEPGQATCFGLLLQAGEFIRISSEIDTGLLRARVLEPREHNLLLIRWVSSFSYPLPLAFEAPTSGTYVVELSVPGASFERVPTFTIQVEEWLSARTQAARREDLQSDPRTAWLREHAVPIRSIDPSDEDFSDLEFLRPQLRDVRVVLLGEGDHGVGSDFKAKTRLIKFLHRELGFDVLAFESGLFGTAAAWRALKTDADPREAFLKGVFEIWAWSEQVQPLIHYLAASAGSDNPLELTGVDIQFSGTAPKESLLPSLREFLDQNGIDSPLADPESGPSQILARGLEGSFAREGGQLPELAEQAELVESLRTTAAQLEASVSGRDGLFWAQVLRSTSVQMGLYLDNLRHPEEATYFQGRDRQMAENLIWLADTYYRGQKIIVWTHTMHAIRNPHMFGREPEFTFTMGHGVWEALGEQSFTIGFTSYTGTAYWVTTPEEWQQHIVADPHPGFEFEELMDAAGHELAWVNLREAREAGQWLGRAFLARPIYFRPTRTPWSELLDAFFFIRTQEPSRKVAGVR
jgi:erythromycin esterase